MISKQNLARATVKAVYDQIKADLDIAAAEIATKRVEPMLGVTTANFKMTPTVSGVDALYARYYLDIQDYAKAAEYSKKVIDNPEFALASTQDAFEAEYTYDKGTELLCNWLGFNYPKKMVLVQIICLLVHSSTKDLFVMEP